MAGAGAWTKLTSSLLPHGSAIILTFAFFPYSFSPSISAVGAVVPRITVGLPMAIGDWREDYGADCQVQLWDSAAGELHA